MKTTVKRYDIIDNLATTAIRLGRELHQKAQTLSLGRDAQEKGFVEDALRHLAEREPFDLEGEASLMAVREILDAELGSEIAGTESRFIESYYDADGQHGEVSECPIYSERGEGLFIIQQTFDSFLEARAEALDRIAGERSVLRLLKL